MRVVARRSTRSALALSVCTILFAASACTDSGSEGGENADVDLSVLGDPQKATGSPVKVGLITDGGISGSTSDPGADLARATVSYLNEYANGLNGHEIELVDCETGNVPSGATACGSEMVKEDVIAAVLPTSTQDLGVFAALKGSGVPYITMTTAIPEIQTDPNAFILSNPLAPFDAIVSVAGENDVDSVGLPIIDVPAATGPVKLLVEDRLEAAGLDLVYTPIPPSVADMTPQIVQMIDSGAGLFVPVGTASFTASALKAIRQNQFDGPVLMGISPITDDFVAAVPGGLEGFINVVGNTEDPEDPDVQLYHAIGAKYDVEGAETATPFGFQTMLSFARMIEGAGDDLTAESVSKALSTMPKPVAKAMGGGIQLQCGQDLAPGQPAVCTLQGLQAVLNADGSADSWDVFG